MAKSNARNKKTLHEKYPPSEPCTCEICLSYCARPGWWTVEEAASALEAGYGNRMMLEIALNLRLAYYLRPSRAVKNRLPQINLRIMAVISSRRIAVNFMGPVTSHWNAVFAIMIAAAWVRNVTLPWKKTGRHPLGRPWLKNGSSKLVYRLSHRLYQACSACVIKIFDCFVG
jgi:hypothetical protein